MSDQILVSTVTSATDTIPRDYDASTVIEAIRTGGKKLRGQVEEIRATMQRELTAHGDEKRAKRAIDPLKKRIPGVLWSGQFSQRANDKLILHSGLLCADLDSLNSELSRVREKLSDSPYLWTLFKSPSGDGLKAVFRVASDQAKHSGSFRAIEQHVRQLTGVQIDQACKDVARLCFLSYDPGIYHNANAREIEPLPEPERPKATLNGAIDLSERQRIAFELLGEVDWQSETSGFVICPGKHLHTSGDSDRDCELHLDNVPTLHCFHNSCRGILNGVNRELRSRIGKAEYTPPDTATAASAASRHAVELPAAPAAYTSPPLTLLPENLREYVQAAAKSLNVDVSFVLLPLLSSLCSAIGNSRSILLKSGFIQPPVIWTGIIGRSGQMKSPAISEGCFAVQKHEFELVNQNKNAFAAYDEALANWDAKLRKDRGVKPAAPVSLTCLMDDMTLEALADTMQSNPRGVLVKKDELSHWLASFDQYHGGKGSDVTRWLSLHTGAFFGVDRRTDHRRYRIQQPRVCITGGIQPAVLRRVLTQDFFERGLPARFLFAAPPARANRWSEETVPDTLRDAVHGLFDELWLLQPASDDYDNHKPVSLTLQPDAKAAYVTYYNECGTASVEGDEHTEAAWNKLSGYAARLALVGQLSANPAAKSVTGEVMKAACDLARWFGNEAVRIYASLAETAEQREARKLVEFIEASGGLVSVRDTYTYHRPLKNDKARAEQALNALEKAGRGEWELVPTTTQGGRPTRKFRLLQASASAKPLKPRGETLSCADADRGAKQQNGESSEPTQETESSNSDRLIEEATRLFNAVPSGELATA
jgi:hypothetical protein